MAFQAEAGQKIIIDDLEYIIMEHPFAPGMPYGQEGRQAIVYSLSCSPRSGQNHDSAEYYALKVFKPRFRLPELVSLAGRISVHGDLPGLAVCRRTVLSSRRHSELLCKHPDLTYAVLMPWIKGPTWMEVLLDKRELTSEQCLLLARSFLETMVAMEEMGIAHCDLSGPNVLLPFFDSSFAESQSLQAVALVDVEQMYGPGLDMPKALPGGSPGYAHNTAENGLWCANADRFAGAVLLVEMLCMCDGRMREELWGETFFDPREMQQDTERYIILSNILSKWWGKDLEETFERAWHSDSLAACPTFGEWLVRLPELKNPLNNILPEKEIKEKTEKKPVIKIKKEGKEEIIPINKPEFIIGRKKDAVDYCVTDNIYVGRVHAKITLDQGICSIVDLNSKNGTFINGERLVGSKPYTLMSKDKVTLANFNFIIEYQ